MDNGAKLLWKYLIDNGGVVGRWSFYGGYFEIDDAMTLDCREGIKKYGIDFNRTKPCDQDTEQSFVDTFADFNDNIEVLTGQLILKNGDAYKWGMTIDEPFNILELIANVIPDPFKDN